MEREILDIALLMLALSVPLHIVLSFGWRRQVSGWIGGLQGSVDSMRWAVNDLAYEPVDDDCPDMIALLGDAYAPAQFTGSRDMTGAELAELIEGERSYPAYGAGGAS